MAEKAEFSAAARATVMGSEKCRPAVAGYRAYWYLSRRRLSLRKRRGKVATNNPSQQVVQKLWNYCNILRDDGLSYGDYVEQLTYLLFLKMAHERTQLPGQSASPIPQDYAWQSLLDKDGDDLEKHYRKTLTKLGEKKGMLGIIFRKAQNKIQDPAKLRRLIADLIDHEQWLLLDTDVKGDAYEGFIGKERARHKRRGRAVLYPPSLNSSNCRCHPSGSW